MRYRLIPSKEQELLLQKYCSHTRYVWNIGLEQRLYWQRGFKSAPNYFEQSRQLTEARNAYNWLKETPFVIQQQALRDLHHAWNNFYRGTHGKPTWRKSQRNEGFRIVDVQLNHVRRISRYIGVVWIPKIGWVKFRWSRPVPKDVKSYRVTLDRSGRWHIGFAVIPPPIPGTGTGEIVGIDRGITKTLTLSDGSTYQCPKDRSVKRLQRKLSRSQRGSNRRKQVRKRLARLYAHNSDTRKDWVEKTTTEIARSYDLIRIEDLKIKNMTKSARGTIQDPGRNVRQKAGLNRAILSSGWGMFETRLQDKASGRVEKVSPAFTSQRCSRCGHISAKSRKSQALFQCVACGFTCNADMNGAKNIAVGHTVTARGGDGKQFRPMNREPYKALVV